VLSGVRLSPASLTFLSVSATDRSFAERGPISRSAEPCSSRGHFPNARSIPDSRQRHGHDQVLPRLRPGEQHDMRAAGGILCSRRRRAGTGASDVSRGWARSRPRDHGPFDYRVSIDGLAKWVHSLRSVSDTRSRHCWAGDDDAVWGVRGPLNVLGAPKSTVFPRRLFGPGSRAAVSRRTA
jgi:hypothetical protein